MKKTELPLFTVLLLTALAAVRRVRALGYDVPFIVVSGSLGEDAAVECLLAGADDYLLKDRLARLGHAVRQALARRSLRNRQQTADDVTAHALRASEERNRLALQAAHISKARMVVAGRS